VNRRVRADVELIELVDADPSAFGGSHEVIGDRFEAPAEAPQREATFPSTAASAWRVGALVIMLAVVASVTAWHLNPWYRDPEVIVRSATVVPSLTDQLVIGRYPGVARSAEISEMSATTPQGFEGGAVFVGPSPSDGGTPNNAIFYRFAAGSQGYTVDQGAAEPITVKGSLGTIAVTGPSILVQWHPADGKDAFLRTTGLDRAATLRLANSLTVRGDAVRVSHRSALAGMHAIGTIADAQQLGAVFQAAQGYAGQPTFGPTGTRSRIVVVRYPAATVAVGEAVGPATHDLLTLLFPVVGHTTADGFDAVVFDTSTNDGTQQVARTTVMWTEGGRIIAVSAPSKALAQQYAEAVRAATDDEWLQVQHLSAPSIGRPSGGTARVV
jgi:hypothetical protein